MQIVHGPGSEVASDHFSQAGVVGRVLLQHEKSGHSGFVGLRKLTLSCAHSHGGSFEQSFAVRMASQAPGSSWCQANRGRFAQLPIALVNSGSEVGSIRVGAVPGWLEMFRHQGKLSLLRRKAFPRKKPPEISGGRCGSLSLLRLGAEL